MCGYEWEQDKNGVILTVEQDEQSRGTRAASAFISREGLAEMVRAVGEKPAGSAAFQCCGAPMRSEDVYQGGGDITTRHVCLTCGRYLIEGVLNEDELATEHEYAEVTGQ